MFADVVGQPARLVVEIQQTNKPVCAEICGVTPLLELGECRIDLVLVEGVFSNSETASLSINAAGTGSVPCSAKR